MNDAPEPQWLSAALCDVIRQKCLPRYGVSGNGNAMHQQERLAGAAAADEQQRIFGDLRGEPKWRATLPSLAGWPERMLRLDAGDYTRGKLSG
jgi:hypothetical protein